MVRGFAVVDWGPARPCSRAGGRLSGDDEDLSALIIEAAPRADADAARALAAARERVLGLRGATRLGRYVLGELLGRGGMGTVFHARDDELDRDVAIKLIRSGQRADALRPEAMALAHLSHPNIVRVFDVGRTPQDDSVFVVMELVRGETLRTWLDGRVRPTIAILKMFEQVARGLAAAHQAGIVHGDVKPSNVLVADDGCAKLVDFGLARVTGDPASTGHDGGSASTRRGGTPGYMAPELLEGQQCDARGDQFAFCVALREALAEADDVPRRIVRLLRRGVERTAARRWPSMADLVDGLAAPSRTRRHAVAPLALATVAVAPLLLSVIPQADEPERQCPPFESSWTDARRTSTGAAIAGTARPWSVAMSTLVVERLDRRDEALAWAWDATCSAPPADAASTRACLGRAAMDLGEVADLLGGSAAVSLRSPTILAVLENASECATAGASESMDASAPAAWRRELADGLVALDDDALDRARTIALKIQAQATTDAWARIAALALWLEGASARRANDLEAEAILRRAADAAAAAGATGVEFLAAVELAELEFAQGRGAAAEHWIDQAMALAERLPESDLARARALAVRAAVDRVAARLDAAQAAAQEARVILEGSLGGDHPDVAAVRVMLGNIAMQRGDRTTARSEFCGAEQVLRAAAGDSATATLEAEMRCASALLHVEPAEAHRRLSALIPRVEAAVGADDILLATSLMNLGLAEKLVGNPAAAVERHQQADAIFMRALGENHPGRVAVLSNMGSALLQTGQPERAELAYARATTLAGSVLGEAHPHAAQAWVGLAETRIVLDHLDGAVEAAERALAIRRHGSFAPPQLAEAEAVLAEALVAARRDLIRARALATSAERTLFARSTKTKEYRRVAALLAALDRVAPTSAPKTRGPSSGR